MFERFTHSARDVVLASRSHARRLGHEQVRAEHLLLAVLAGETQGGVVLRELGLRQAHLETEVRALGHADAAALQSLGVDLEAVREQVEAAFGPDALRPRAPMRRRGLLRRRRPAQERDHLDFTPGAKRALEQSLRQALALGDKEIRAEHVLLGLLATDGDPAAVLLSRLGVAPAAVRDRLRAVSGDRRAS